ncbi:MAG TPA: DUF4214 domain-containing protein [Coleofasciculaceae cyanobacterium]|jgi:hypothetical protein
MKLAVTASAFFSVLSVSSILSLAIAPAQAQRTCVVTDSNQVVCGRPYNDSRPDSRPERPSRDAFREINDIYRDVLGRNADREGLRIWTRALEDGKSLSDVRREVARTSEAQNKINQLYQEVLGRDVDRSGLQTWTSALEDGKSLNDVRRALENSEEARLRRR